MEPHLFTILITACLLATAAAKPLIALAVQAVGGEDKLFKIFRMKEEYSVMPEPKPKVQDLLKDIQQSPTVKLG